MDREPDISLGIIHRPRTSHFAWYYPSTENQTFRLVVSIDREQDLSRCIIQVKVYYRKLCACWVPNSLTDNHKVNCMGLVHLTLNANQ
jgi:hypothetical protein